MMLVIMMVVMVTMNMMIMTHDNDNNFLMVWFCRIQHFWSKIRLNSSSGLGHCDVGRLILRLFGDLNCPAKKKGDPFFGGIFF